MHFFEGKTYLFLFSTASFASDASPNLDANILCETLNIEIYYR